MMRNHGKRTRAWGVALLMALVPASEWPLTCIAAPGADAATGQARQTETAKPISQAVPARKAQAKPSVVGDRQVGHRSKAPAAKPSTPPPSALNMQELIDRLKRTPAMGVFTKLALRSDALDLIELVRDWRAHRRRCSVKEIRARFDGLLLKVLALLDDDPALARDISRAREDIWRSLLRQGERRAARSQTRLGTGRAMAWMSAGSKEVKA